MSEFRVTNFRQELKVLAVLVCFLAGLELIARMISESLDDDRAHIAQFDELVGELGEKKGAVLGNSLLLHGLNLEQFAQESPDFSTIRVTPVSSAVLDWGHLYERYFLKGEELPEHLFVGFVAHHVDDSEPAKLRRLSRHFVSTGSLSQLWERERFDPHQRVQSGLSHVSALIGDQPAHRERVLDYFIDWYRLGLRTNQDWVTGEVESSIERQSSFERMTRFIDMVQAGGTRLWIIPLSQPEYWELNSGLLELIEKKGIGLMDARSIPGMTADDFSDGYHLGESGAEKFTKWFAKEISEKITQDP
ncbi:MAG: hypothetical protein CBC46_02345 [Verrucomicrobiaceae bacterium TMED86]|nr:MAG: hypothetical protein CBC46_02345 [Verrucomicrobiaceae bacterium TMED86]